jgi:hypothetical protein
MLLNRACVTGKAIARILVGAFGGGSQEFHAFHEFAVEYHNKAGLLSWADSRTRYA